MDSAATVYAAMDFLYLTAFPRSIVGPLAILFVYVLHLIIASLILYYSIKFAGGSVAFRTGFPKAVLATFVRDILLVPLIFLSFFIPMLGPFLALVLWLAIIKFIFQLGWGRTVLAFIISIILPVIIVFFILLPLLFLLAPWL